MSLASLREKMGKINLRPTDGQKRAGNYAKGHVRVLGFDIVIENPKGSIRSGTAADGKKWEAKLPDHYGYFARSKGADADNVDVYIGPDDKSKMVYVIDQKHHQSGKFDEHKVMLCYSSYGDAVKSYCSAFTDGKDRVLTVTIMTLKQFREWLRSGNTQQKTKRHWSHSIYRRQ